MNIEFFKLHTASRKPKPIPLRTKKKKFEPPELYTECSVPNEYVRLEESKVSFIDLKKSTQVIIIELKNPEKFNAWLKRVYGIERERCDIRLSRFQRAFGGMSNPRIRTWKIDDDFKQVSTEIRPGDTVECAFLARLAKGKVYFDLHRDIIVRTQKKRKKILYFSDDE